MFYPGKGAVAILFGYKDVSYACTGEGGVAEGGRTLEIPSGVDIAAIIYCNTIAHFHIISITTYLFYPCKSAITILFGNEYVVITCQGSIAEGSCTVEISCDVHITATIYCYILDSLVATTTCFFCPHKSPIAILLGDKYISTTSTSATNIANQGSTAEVCTTREISSTVDVATTIYGYAFTEVLTSVTYFP